MLTRPHVHCRRDRQAPSPSPSSLVPPMREMTVRDSPEHRAGLPFRPNSSPEDSLWHPDPAHGMVRRRLGSAITSPSASSRPTCGCLSSD